MRRSQATFKHIQTICGHDTENKFVVKEARLHTSIYSPLRLLKGPREVIREVPQEAAQLRAAVHHECSLIFCQRSPRKSSFALARSIEYR